MWSPTFLVRVIERSLACKIEWYGPRQNTNNALSAICWNLEPAGPEKPPLRQATRSIRTARTIPDLSCLSLGEKIVSTGNEYRLHIGVGIECVAQPFNLCQGGPASGLLACLLACLLVCVLQRLRAPILMRFHRPQHPGIAHASVASLLEHREGLQPSIVPALSRHGPRATGSNLASRHETRDETQ